MDGTIQHGTREANQAAMPDAKDVSDGKGPKLPESVINPLKDRLDGYIENLASAEHSRLLSTLKKKELREHQKVANSAVVNGIKEGKEVLTVIQTTGSGKTGEFTSLVEASELTTLVLVPRIKLVHQTAKEFEEFTQLTVNKRPTPENPEGTYHNPAGISKFYGNEKNISGKVVVCTYDSLDALIEAAEAAGKKFQLVVLDEAHRSLSTHLQDSLKKVMDGAITVAYTATPVFNEEKDVRITYGQPVYELKIQESINKGINSGARVIGIKTSTSLEGIDRNENGEFNSVQLDNRINTESRNRAAIELLKHPSSKGKGAVAFCNSKQHAEDVHKIAAAEGIRSAFIHSDMSEREREKIYNDFDTGKIDLLCSVDLLNEGWDSPRAKIGLMLRPTNSLVLAEQRGGRLLRLFKDQFATIFEFIDKDAHGITMVDILGGTAILPATLNEAIEKQDKEKGEIKTEDLTKIPGLEGFEVFIKQEEILKLLKGSEPEPIPELTREKAREIVLSKSTLKECVSLRRTFEFLQTSLTPKPVSGKKAKPDESTLGLSNMRRLVTQYFHDVKKEPVAFVSPKELRIFFEDIFGEEYKKAFTQTLLSEIKGERKSQVLKDILEISQELNSHEFMDAKIAIGGFIKGELSVRQILQHLKISDTSDAITVSTDGLSRLMSDRASRISIHEEPDRALLGFAESFLTAEKAESYLFDRSEIQTIRGLSRQGALLPLIEEIPDVQNLSKANFEKMVVRDGKGHALSGAAVLKYYEIRDENDYAAFSEQLIPRSPEHPQPANEAGSIGDTMRLQAEAALRATPHDVRRLLDAINLTSNEDIPALEVEVGPSREKIKISVGAFFEAFSSTQHIQGQLGSGEKLQANFKSMAILYDFAYPGRILSEGSWQDSRELNALFKDGSMAAIIQSDPFVGLSTYESFKDRTIQFPHSQVRCSGNDILKRFNVGDEPSFQALIAETMPQGYQERLRTSVLTQLKRRLTESPETRDAMAKISLTDFRSRNFHIVSDPADRQAAEDAIRSRKWEIKEKASTSMTGAQIIRFMEQDPTSFTGFKKALGDITGEEKFSKAFALGDTDSVCTQLHRALKDFYKANSISGLNEMNTTQIRALKVSIPSNAGFLDVSLPRLVFLYNQYRVVQPKGLGDGISIQNVVKVNSGDNASMQEIASFLSNDYFPWLRNEASRRKAAQAAKVGTD